MPTLQDSTNTTVYEKPFSASVMIKSAEERDGKWIVSGPMVSLVEDYDTDIIEKCAVNRGLKAFKDFGSQVDFEHQYSKTKDLDFIIGKGIDIRDVDGKPWLTTQLHKSKPYAQKLWRHLGDEGEAGYSIEGICKARSSKDHKRIIDMEIHRVTISPSPKGLGETKIQIGTPFNAVMKAIVDDVAHGKFCEWNESDSCEFGSCDLTEFSKAAMIDAIEDDTNLYTKMLTSGLTTTSMVMNDTDLISKAVTEHNEDNVGDKCPDCGTEFTGSSPKNRFVKGLKLAIAGGESEDPEMMDSIMHHMGRLIGHKADKAGHKEDCAPSCWSKFNGMDHDLCDELGIGGCCPGCGCIHCKPSSKMEKAAGIKHKAKDAPSVPNNGGDPEKIAPSDGTCKGCGHKWPHGSPKEHFEDGYGKEMEGKKGAYKDEAHTWAGRYSAKRYKLGGKGIEHIAESWNTHTKQQEGMHKHLGLKGSYCKECGGFKMEAKAIKPSKAAKMSKGAWLYANEDTNVFLSWDNYLTRHPDQKGVEPILKADTLYWDAESLGIDDDILKSILDDEAAPRIIFDWARTVLSEWKPLNDDTLEIEKSMTTGEGIVQAGQEGAEALREQEMLGEVPSVGADGKKKKGPALRSSKKKKNADGTDSDEDDDSTEIAFMGVKKAAHPEAHRIFSEETRKKDAASGVAEDDGSYPISDLDSLHRAIQSVGRSGDIAKTKAHIKSRAKALGAEHLIPAHWHHDKMDKSLEETFKNPLSFLTVLKRFKDQ